MDNLKFIKLHSGLYVKLWSSVKYAISYYWSIWLTI
jgi:hypothetical protein